MGFAVRMTDIMIHPKDWVNETVTNDLLAPAGVSVSYTPSIVDINDIPVSQQQSYQIGSSLADLATQTGIGVGIGIANDAFTSQTMIGNRYVSSAEMGNIVANDGRIPTEYANGLPKDVISFTDQTYTDAKTATDKLRVGPLDPRGAQSSPTYGVAFKIVRGDATYIGMTDGGGEEWQTTKSLQIFKWWELDPDGQ